MASNPNTISAGIKETWDNVYQVTHHKVPVYPAISNFRLAAGLKQGDTVNRQYRNSLVANDMGGDGSFERQAITDTNEQLTISYVKEASFYIKELDELQNHLPVRMKHAYDASVAIFNSIDAEVLGTYDQFTNSLDDGDLGGTAGNGITVTTSNIMKLFSNSTRLMQRFNIMIDNTAAFTGFKMEDSKKVMAVAVISPDLFQIIIERLEGKDSLLGDKTGIEGHAGRYMGYELFVSNAVGWSAELALATLPTDGDTVTINGVVFTFETGTLDAAGKVKAETSGDVSLTNLANAINNSESLAASTLGTTYYELSASNRALMSGITATADTTNNKITLKAKGKGFVVVSETLTAAADIWTAAKQVQHCLFGVANSIDVVVQKTPSMKVQDRDGKVGVDVVTWAAFGVKVFNESKYSMIDVWVRTDAYTS